MDSKKQQIIDYFIKAEQMCLIDIEFENVVECIECTTFDEWRDYKIESYDIHSHLIEYVDFAKMLIQDDSFRVFGFRSSSKNGITTEEIYELTDETKSSWFESAYVIRAF